MTRRGEEEAADDIMVVPGRRTDGDEAVATEDHAASATEEGHSDPRVGQTKAPNTEPADMHTEEEYRLKRRDAEHRNKTFSDRPR
jgi:hypothetical protein